MSKTRESKVKQFRWTKPMERMMLGILADEVKLRNRPNNAFKTSSFSRVAKSVSNQYGVECSPVHVENHLRTVKTTWSVVEILHVKTGLGWDENLKMVTAGPDEYDEHVQANSNHEKYLNKKIEMYDEMAIIVGKDKARGNFAKSFEDIDLETRPEFESIDDDMNVEEVSKEREDEKQSNSSRSTSSQARPHRKRSRATYDGEQQIGLISEKLGKVAVALGRLTENCLVVSNLYDEVMKTEGFDDEFLVSAFDYLVQHEMLAKAFIAKNSKLRKLWLENYKKQMN